MRGAFRRKMSEGHALFHQKRKGDAGHHDKHHSLNNGEDLGDRTIIGEKSQAKDVKEGSFGGLPLRGVLKGVAQLFRRVHDLRQEGQHVVS